MIISNDTLYAKFGPDKEKTLEIDNQMKMFV